MVVTQTRTDNAKVVPGKNYFLLTIDRTNKAAENIFEALKNTTDPTTKKLLFKSLDRTFHESESNLSGVYWNGKTMDKRESRKRP